MGVHDSSLSRPRYRPDIDGLRAIAVLAVVAFHAFPGRLPGGFIGVDVFFVISGFLISTIIFENLERGTFKFSEFYSRRIRRIFPALIATLGGVLILGWFLMIAEELNQLGKQIAAGAFFFTNFLLRGEAGYFDQSAEYKPLLHLWSLGIEEQFYIFWPLLVWLAWKSKINLLTLTFIIVLVSFYLNIHRITIDPVGTFYLPQTRFWELLCGSVLAKLVITPAIPPRIRRFLNRGVFHNSSKYFSETLCHLYSLLGILLLTLGFFMFDSTMVYPGFWAIIPVISTMLIIIAGPRAWINRNILSHKFLIWFGLISFPLYLWHWPLISFSWIIVGEAPSTIVRLGVIVLSVALALLTTQLIEKPFRYGNSRIRLKTLCLCAGIAIVGLSGLVLNHANLSNSHNFKDLAIKREGFEYAIGSSLNWYQGKDNWLFLGNNYDDSIAKLKLAKIPTNDLLESNQELFNEIASTAAQYSSPVILIVGPSKENIYPEYLPDDVRPASIKYSSYFLEKLQNIPNLIVYDPTKDLLTLKKSEGLLYWKTDTHWNRKGAFLTFRGFLERLSLPIPEVNFQKGSTHSGDLIGISKLERFPLDFRDDWKVVLKKQPMLERRIIPNEKITTFGLAEVVTNQNPLSDSHVWVIGVSCSVEMRNFFNATFKEVRYVGHWEDKLSSLSTDLAITKKKPDMVVIVKSERSF